MATFNVDERESLDFVVLRDGGISLYRRQNFLAEDIAWLEQAGYRLVRFACHEWKTDRDMHVSLSSTFNFPNYYGMNLDALNDVIYDIDVPNAGGSAVVFYSYDQFISSEDGSRNKTAETLLDILSRASHEFLLTGRRLVILVQSNDPRLEFPKLGGHQPSWNWREWLNSERGL